jgi:hypothetical protein
MPLTPADETTPAAITRAITSFCESIGAEPPVYLPVRQDQNAIFGLCNLNVLVKVERSGGGIQYGWMIWELPGLFLNAELHAVWVDTDGTLVDISPKSDGETQILYAADFSFPPYFEFEKHPPKDRRRIGSIYEATSVSDRAKQRISTLSSSQSTYETQRASKKHMTLEQWIGSRLPTDPLPGLVDRYLRALRERDALLIPIKPTGLGCAEADLPRIAELNEVQKQTKAEILKIVNSRLDS